MRLTAAGLTAFALVVALPAASAAADPPLPIVQVGPADYPEGVTVTDAERRVLVSYSLAPTGLASSCAVARSSGEPDIDTASCRIVVERLRLRPTGGGSTGRIGFIWLGERATMMGNPRGAPLPVTPVAWVSVSDYPTAARRFRQVGTVAYEARVSANGIVTGCTVVGSSNSAALDRRTCEIVTARGAFIPASDGAGGVRDGVYRGRITWRLP